ncbi:unnamed protein product [Cylicocyclus nassatus]|uniref:Uncharacterized protein n=1 Tax=Cylicocyclus nassatus TaxID=53992 RepID=A0AA36GYK3_CYLNA|nr:unnamed protein product [Cylicocyclus nassatus]
MLLAASFRIYIVPVRLILGRSYENSWIRSIETFCFAAEQLFVFQLDTAIFLISVERLIATVHVKHYEYMFRTAAHKVVLITLFVILDCVCSYFFFSDANLYHGSITLMYFSGIATTTRITGFAVKITLANFVFQAPINAILVSLDLADLYAFSLPPTFQ